MNRYGVIVDEIGMRDAMASLRDTVGVPLVKVKINSFLFSI